MEMVGVLVVVIRDKTVPSLTATAPRERLGI